MALDIKKFIGRFVEEAKDHLGRMSSGLADLEQGSASAEEVNSLLLSWRTVWKMCSALCVNSSCRSIQQ